MLFMASNSEWSSAWLLSLASRKDGELIEVKSCTSLPLAAEERFWT